MPKTRLDQRVHALGLTESREQARRLIMAGEVLVDGQRVDRPAARVDEAAEIALKAKPRFVSRGGEKLEAALAHFQINVAGRACADVGASTGGFTDCLLQRGAARVIALDVGYGQLDWRLRHDERVTVMERKNARELGPGDLSYAPELVTVDVSFISLAKLVGPIVAVGERDLDLLAMVKPQFELGPERVGRGGVVRDAEARRDAIRGVVAAVRDAGLLLRGLASSGLPGPKGNRETFVWAARAGAQADLERELDRVEP